MSLTIKSLIPKILSNIQFHLPSSNKHASSSLRNISEKPSNLSQYIIVKATKDDYLPILDLMHNAYYPDEPACSSLGIEPNPVMDERVVKDMAEGMSLVARTKSDGEIVGACVNCSLYPWDPEHTEKLARSCKCSHLKQLLFFYAYLTRKPDLWKTLKVKKVFEMEYLFVKSEHRGRGISLRMMQDSRKLSSDKGFKVVRCDATSFVTAKLCEKLGMEMIDEIPYNSYKGQNLEPVFRPPAPHQSVKIYIHKNVESTDITPRDEYRKTIVTVS